MTTHIDRRNFLKKSAMGLTGVLVLPAFLKLQGNDALATVKNVNSIKDYYDRFNVTEEMLAKVMSEALSRGGDYCDLFFQH